MQVQIIVLRLEKLNTQAVKWEMYGLLGERDSQYEYISSKTNWEKGFTFISRWVNIWLYEIGIASDEQSFAALVIILQQNNTQPVLLQV